MKEKQLKEIMDELKAIKNRLSNIENKLFQNTMPATSPINEPFCAHTFVNTTTGNQCSKCGMIMGIIF